jgi:lipopolysaccharide export system protein LptA
MTPSAGFPPHPIDPVPTSRAPGCPLAALHASERPLPASGSRRARQAAALICIALTTSAVAPSAKAEKADRDKPIQVEADRMEYDDQRKINVFTGRVVLTKGSILIRADRLTVREDDKGFQFGQAIGEPASFRQKREGLDEHVEGYGNTVDYDGRDEIVTLTGRASLRRLERDRLTDEVHGNRIIYRSQTEFYTVESGSGPEADRQRVRVVIQPRRTSADSPDKPGAPTDRPAASRDPGVAPLQPSPSITRPPAR